MSKIAVVYWSGSGNTEIMAEAVADGIREAGSEAVVYTAGEFSVAEANGFDKIAFGCPSMGDEVLEEGEFQPMYDDVSEILSGKKVVLFGSYGWGDGEWMRNWQEDIKAKGAVLIADGVIANEEPDDSAKEDCQKLGKEIALA